MPSICALFFVAAWYLAVIIGPQTRAWTWGPALLMLCLALGCSLTMWKRNPATRFSLTSLVLLALSAAWLGCRAWVSPIRELAVSDSLLVCATVGSFVTIRHISGNKRAEKILHWGLALLLLASILLLVQQTLQPGYTVFFKSPQNFKPSAFHTHYNEAANFLLACSLLIGGVALFGHHHLITRLFWGILAIGGLAAIWLTGSRGGTLGAAAGFSVFVLFSLIIAKKRKATWFKTAMIALPIFLFTAVAFLYYGWQWAQQARGGETHLSAIFDNTYRLFFLGIAVSSFLTHPFIGGGSGSFSWESIQFWNVKSYGLGIALPEYAHNEIIQLATDYGLIGLLLVGALCFCCMLFALLNTLFEHHTSTPDHRHAWRVGGIAALFGVIVHSCFSFVFHMLPGAILLGIFLAFLSRCENASHSPEPKISRFTSLALALFSLCVALPYAWKGSVITQHLWPVFYQTNQQISDTTKIQAWSHAIQTWPTAVFYSERGRIYHRLAQAPLPPAETHALASLSLADYQSGAKLHPFHPIFPINSALALAILHQDEAAVKAFQHAISLQGEMESAFRSHFLLAQFYLERALALRLPEQQTQQLATLELALTSILNSEKISDWGSPEGAQTNLRIYDTLGKAHEAAGNFSRAYEVYLAGAKLPWAEWIHFRAAVALAQIAQQHWNRGDLKSAYATFTDARLRINNASNQRPQDVSPEEQAAFIRSLDETIATLKPAIESISATPLAQP